MCSRRIISNIVRGGSNLCRSRVHGSLVQIVPEGAEIHIISAPVVEQIGVNRIVGLGRRGSDTRASTISPSAGLHGRRCGQSNGRILRAECRDGIVYVIEAIYELHIGGLADWLGYTCSKDTQANLPKDRHFRQGRLKIHWAT